MPYPKTVIATVILVVATLVYSPLLRVLLYSPWVDPSFPDLMLILLVPAGIVWGLSALTAAISLTACMFTQVRKPASVIFLSSLSILVACWVTAAFSYLASENGLASAADRFTPLISAIRKYTEKNGQPPSELKVLVPEYLPTLPSTDLGAFPDYQYSLNPHENGVSAPWEISIPMKQFTSISYLYYWPTEVYPQYQEDEKHQNRILERFERVKNWMYVTWQVEEDSEAQSSEPTK